VAMSHRAKRNDLAGAPLLVKLQSGSRHPGQTRPNQMKTYSSCLHLVSTHAQYGAVRTRGSNLVNISVGVVEWMNQWPTYTTLFINGNGSNY